MGDEMNELTVIDKTLNQAAGQFVSTISQYQWDLIPDSQLQAAKQALTKNDYIMKIAVQDPEAVKDALIRSAILGLDLTEGKRQGWLLPRKDSRGKTVIQLQAGYKGVEAIHQRMGVIDRLVVRVVHQNDEFDWSGDDQEKPNHKGNWFASDDERGPIIGAYAITYYPNGSIQVTVTSINEIYEKHRDCSDSWKSYQQKTAKGEKAFPPPWVTHEKAMIEKTMAYVASKQWPANIRDQSASSKILETLHEIDVADYTQKYTQQQYETFHKLVNESDGLGLYLMSKRLDIESYAALFGTFEKGQKTAMKSKVRELESVGSQTMAAVEESLENKDIGGLFENIEDCAEETLKVLPLMLSAAHRAVFDELIEANNTVNREKANVSEANQDAETGSD